MVPKTIGRYEIKAELGRGGMATVYHGFDPRFKRDVAIKVLPREFLHDPSFQARFQREAETIAALEHGAIVPVYDFGEEDGQPFLVMRFMPGGSLSDRIKRGPLAPSKAARILDRISAALDRAHSRDVIHRDIKPDNILFDADEEPYIADFGLVKIVTPEEGSLTAAGSVVGTPAYTSPEQARGDRDLDGRSDIYSLGVTLFQMLSGKLPYEADTPMSILVKHITDPIPRILEANPDLPPACEALIQKAMAKDREQRFATAGAMAAMLDAIAQGGAAPPPAAATPVIVSPQPPTTPQHVLPPAAGDKAGPIITPPRQWPSRLGALVKGRAGLAIVALLSVFILLALVLGFGLYGPTPTEPTQAPAATRPQAAVTPGGATGEPLEPLLTIVAGDETVRSVAFSPDGTRLASGGEDRIIHIWDTANGQELFSLKGHTDIVTSLAWSPDGSKLASGSDDQTIRIWDAASGALVLPPLQEHTYFVFAIAWSPNGTWLASAGWDNQVIVWDSETGAVVSRTDVRFQATGVAWSPDSTRLAVSFVRQVLVLDPNHGNELQRLSGEWGDSLGVDWSPDGQYIAIAGHDNNVHVWQVDHWENERLLQGHEDTVTCVAFSPNSKWLASAAYDTMVHIWDVSGTTQDPPVQSIPLIGTSNTLDWSHDGKYLAGSGEGIIWIWDAGLFEPLP